MTAVYDASTAHDEPGTQSGRTPPQDLDAEMSVLSAMMLSTDAITAVVELLGTGEEFYRPAHQTIYRTLVVMWRSGERPDPITLAAALDKTGDLHRAGGRPYLHQLASFAPTTANADYYAELVRERWMLRRVIEAGTRLVQMGYSPGATPAGTVDQAAVELQQLTTAAAPDSASREKTLAVMLADFMDSYDAGVIESLPLPYSDLQRMAPMEPGDFVVIAGRPAMGKTVVLMDIARHVAIEHNMSVLVASMEMSHSQLTQRIIAAEAKVALHHLRQRTLDDFDRGKVDDAVARILSAPLRVDDTPAVPISKWRARLRQLQAEGQLPAVLIVDYLQIAKAEAAAGANRTGEVDALASGLAALAQEFQIVVIAAAQLNRQVEMRQDKTPAMADLRESGTIEASANVVILLYRHDYYEPESARAGELDLIVGKNRMGSTGTVTVAFKGHQARAVDMARA